MNIWIVPSHHDICPEPWKKYGVQLQPKDIADGFEVWNRTSSYEAAEDIIKGTFSLRRSGNELSYNEAISALSKASAPNTFAVLVFKWSNRRSLSGKWQLETPHRAWLAVYRDGNVPRFTLPENFVDQGRCHSFLECVEGDNWTEAFNQLLQLQTV